MKRDTVRLVVGLAVVLGMVGVCNAEPKPIIERLLPIPKTSGFKMESWFVWGGSVIKVGDTFHLFASRWPEETGFPNGYRSHSQIVRATAKDRMAEADRFDGTYKIVARNITARSEDPDLYRSDGTYHLTVSDCMRRITGIKKACAHLVSQDGRHWEKHPSPIVFTRKLQWDDGTTTEVQRRERAELFNANAEQGQRGTDPSIDGGAGGRQDLVPGPGHHPTQKVKEKRCEI